jgi:hypothetical protein
VPQPHNCESRFLLDYALSDTLEFPASSPPLYALANGNHSQELLASTRYSIAMLCPTVTGVRATSRACERGRKAGEIQLVYDAPFGISSFGEDEQGRVYLADFEGGILYELIEAEESTPTPSVTPGAGETGMLYLPLLSKQGRITGELP